MLVKFFRRRPGAPGEDYVAQAEFSAVPRAGDWICFNPDDASEVVDMVTFCLPYKGHAAYAIVVT